MKTGERFVIYGLLLLLVGANLPGLLGGADRTAVAQDATPAVSELPAGGPFGALTLQGSDEDEVVLRGRDGRIAWSDSPHDRAYSVAYMHIGRVLNKLMRSGDLDEDRERLMDELREEEARFREQLEGIRESIVQLDPESDEARTMSEEGQALYQEYMAWQQTAVERRGRLDAAHLEQVYREMVEAVEVVAERGGIDTVYRFIPTSDPFDAENPEQAMMAIRLRSVLRYPKQLDITDDVLEELALPLD